MKRSMDREGCPKLFSLCVEYRTTVLLRGISLLKVVGNHIVHKTIHQPSHIAALGGTPRKDLTKSFAEKVVEAGVSGAHRPETFRRVSPSVTARSIRIGYSPECRRILLPPHWTGVSGQHTPECPAQPETPVCASRRLWYSK